MSSLNLAESITSIGACAFYECPNLTNIRITPGITHIGGGAFSFETLSANFCTQYRTVTIASPTVAASNAKDYSNFEGITNSYGVCSLIFGQLLTDNKNHPYISVKMVYATYLVFSSSILFFNSLNAFSKSNPFLNFLMFPLTVINQVGLFFSKK